MDLLVKTRTKSFCKCSAFCCVSCLAVYLLFIMRMVDVSNEYILDYILGGCFAVPHTKLAWSWTTYHQEQLLTRKHHHLGLSKLSVEQRQHNGLTFMSCLADCYDEWLQIERLESPRESQPLPSAIVHPQRQKRPDQNMRLPHENRLGDEPKVFQLKLNKQ